MLTYHMEIRTRNLAPPHQTGISSDSSLIVSVMMSLWTPPVIASLVATSGWQKKKEKKKKRKKDKKKKEKKVLYCCIRVSAVDIEKLVQCVTAGDWWCIPVSVSPSVSCSCGFVCFVACYTESNRQSKIPGVLTNSCKSQTGSVTSGSLPEGFCFCSTFH